MNESLDETLRDAAMEYHRQPTAGKISIAPTKSLVNQHDLSLAYSPGVAYPCLAIRDDPLQAATLTSRANLVAVVTNGTAVLGLGNIGALAGKPVMEGKGCLFKKFSGIDVFDIEIDATDPDKIVDIVAALEPTFGGINLEDIKAPECFIVERKLRERMKIPVFHDDQHGTAIIVSAAILNGLKFVGKDIGKVRLAGSGAGAAAIACLDLLVAIGLRRENITICDSKGVVHRGRQDLDGDKARYATDTGARTLADAMDGADIFLGLSQGGLVKPDMVKSLAATPLILALANPEPEIRPEAVKEVRSDALIFTGRSDYPNQVKDQNACPGPQSRIPDHVGDRLSGGDFLITHAQDIGKRCPAARNHRAGGPCAQKKRTGRHKVADVEIAAALKFAQAVHFRSSFKSLTFASRFRFVSFRSVSCSAPALGRAAPDSMLIRVGRLVASSAAAAPSTAPVQKSRSSIPSSLPIVSALRSPRDSRSNASLRSALSIRACP